MGPNIWYTWKKSIWKTLSSQCHLFLHIFTFIFYILSMNVQKLLHPLINHMHEVLQQVNHEEYSQKPWRDQKHSAHKIFIVSGFFPVFYES